MLAPKTKTFFLPIQWVITPISGPEFCLPFKQLSTIWSFYTWSQKLFWSNWTLVCDKPVSVSSAAACQFYSLKTTSRSCLVLRTSPTHSATSVQALTIHFRGTFLFTHQNNWGWSQPFFPIRKWWCRNAAGGTLSLCTLGRCFYYVPLAAFPNPILLFFSLIRNCLDEPHEDAMPCRQVPHKGCKRGPVAQCVGPAAFRQAACGSRSRQTPSLAVAPHTGLQLTPRFTLHRHRAPFNWLNIIVHID